MVKMAPLASIRGRQSPESRLERPGRAHRVFLRGVAVLLAAPPSADRAFARHLGRLRAVGEIEDADHSAEDDEGLVERGSAIIRGKCGRCSREAMCSPILPAGIPGPHIGQPTGIRAGFFTGTRSFSFSANVVILRRRDDRRERALTGRYGNVFPTRVGAKWLALRIISG